MFNKKSADQPKVVKEGKFKGLCASASELKALEKADKDLARSSSFLSSALSTVKDTAEAERSQVIAALRPSVKIALELRQAALDDYQSLLRIVSFRPVINELKTCGLVD